MFMLIDGDLVVYRAGFAAEHKIHTLDIQGSNERAVIFEFTSKREARQFIKENGMEDFTLTTRLTIEPIAHCLHTVKLMLASWTKKYGDKYQIFLSGTGNYRYDLATIQPYKGNRKGMRKPIHYEDITKYLRNVYDAVLVDGQEADDSISIAAHNLRKRGIEYVVLSLDKDLDQVPGKHWNWVKGNEYEISSEKATRLFYQQILSGDGTDNIRGIPGVGKVKAERILAESLGEGELCEACVQTYVDRFGEEDGRSQFLETARLIYIRQKDNEIWQPKKRC